MPISPLLCLKFVPEVRWQKATNSRLFCSTVAWGRLARVLLALPLLGEMPACTWCSGEHGESTPGTWEPGVEGVKKSMARANNVTKQVRIYKKHMCESYQYTYKSVMQHIWTSHVKRKNGSRHTNVRVMSHKFVCHVAHMNRSHTHDSCHKYTSEKYEA